MLTTVSSSAKNPLNMYFILSTEGCTTDQSCLAEDETEPDSNEGLGGDVLMKLLHLARQHPASRNHQWASEERGINLIFI